jgi:Ni/Co efflux regulator RcnB
MTRHRLIPTAIALALLAAPSAASAADRDHDNMRDSWEKRFGLSTKKKNGKKDRDRDGLRNLHEYRAGMNPRDKDSDNDGRRDGREGAGKIKSFDAETGVLVIDRFRGGDLTGKVDSTTEIECEDHSRRHSGDDDGPGDTSGNGTPEDGPGDTRGDGTPEDNKVAAKSGDDDDRSGSNSGPGSGDDRGDDDDRCGVENLVVGRTVKEAELHTGDDGAHDTFDEIEVLVRK